MFSSASDIFRKVQSFIAIKLLYLRDWGGLHKGMKVYDKSNKGLSVCFQEVRTGQGAKEGSPNPSFLWKTSGRREIVSVTAGAGSEKPHAVSSTTKPNKCLNMSPEINEKKETRGSRGFSIEPEEPYEEFNSLQQQKERKQKDQLDYLILLKNLDTPPPSPPNKIASF